LEERTKELLSKNKDSLLKIAGLLEQEEVLNGEDLRLNMA
jgi:hypothetical protein